jgi:H+-transporting ATPase
MIELNGLTAEEAHKGLQKYGLNTLPEEKHNPFIGFLHKFWAPVPWMLEIIILLEILLGKFAEAWVIAILVLFNAILSFFQEGKAKNALRLLRNRLNVQARVLRDGEWRLISAQELVPEDIIRILIVHTPVKNGKAIVSGDFHIDGVPGPVAKISVDMTACGGMRGKGELYMGMPKDEVNVPDMGKITWTLGQDSHI